MVTRGVAQVQSVLEAVVLSTCNRGEIIAATNEPEESRKRLVEAIAEIHRVDAQFFQDHLYFKTGLDAARHVFRVASSLDSMVLGEPQILGQVKESYRLAARVNATGPIVNRLMHRAFFTAKRVRHETGVGRAAVSVAYAAVELAVKILGDLKRKRVLLIGAGEMAELAARHLSAKVDDPIMVANRTYENACTLAEQLSGEALAMNRLDEALMTADVVITSTASCEPLIRKDHAKAVMRKRRFRPLFFIDIAVPRDVEPAVNEIDGVYLYNIDDLQAVVQENLGDRRQASLRAESIVADEALKFIEWTRSLSAAPTIVALKDKLETIRQAELARLNGKLSEMTPEHRQIIETITRGMINKIAHDPISFLKRTGSGSRVGQQLAIAQRLFNLNGSSSDREEASEEASAE
jgi:glutamyl-tRNA reductase